MKNKSPDLAKILPKNRTFFREHMLVILGVGTNKNRRKLFDAAFEEYYLAYKRLGPVQFGKVWRNHLQWVRNGCGQFDHK